MRGCRQRRWPPQDNLLLQELRRLKDEEPYVSPTAVRYAAVDILLRHVVVPSCRMLP